MVMKITEASIKLSIPRYYIDYWKKVGLISKPESRLLDFSDLIKIKFIDRCKKNRISLQKIRTILRNSVVESNSWHENLFITPGLLLIKAQSLLLEPTSKQIHFEFNFSGNEGNVLSLWGSRDDNPEVSEYEELYLASLETGDIQSIKNILKKILKVKGDHIGALIESGNIAFEENDFDLALKYYSLAEEYDNGCVEAIYNMANIFFRQKKYAVAIRNFQRCIELDPDFPESYYNLGLVYYSLKYFDKALVFLKMYLEIDSDSTWAEQARIFISGILEQSASVSESELFNF